MASNRKLYENTQPALIIPDHFFCNQSSKVVVIYDDPIGEEDDVMTLMFPGDVSGSSPKRVVPERIGTRTLVFDTPVYSSCRGVVEVLPLLNLQNGEVAQLAHFKLTLKHPIRNVMELCLNLSTNNAILPVLLSLMVHCQGDNCKEHFQDPHIDRVMATLVGSRTPGDSTCIQDIILPSRKWRRLNLAEFARHFSLTEMEKQAYVLNKQRSKWASKAKNSPKRTKTVLRSRTTDVEGGDLEDDDEEGEERLHQHLSNSTPDIHTIHTAVDKQEQRDSGVSDDSDIVQKFVRGAKFVCRVVEDFTPSHDQPSCIPLRVNQEVHIVQESNPDWWYGVCEDRCGYFPPSNVQTLKAPTTTKMRSTTSSQRPLNPRPDLSASFHEELSSHRLNFRNMSSAHERTRTESERSESSQPESPRRDRLRTTPNRMIVGSGLKRREDCGSSGAQSDSGLAIIEESISSKRPSVPSTKQQLLHKVTPILPPNSYKSYHSGSSHLPTSPNHADSVVNSAGYESTNVESSESDGYEDVMSGDEDGTAVKSPWTFGGKTTSPTTVAEKEVKKQFILPFMRDKILPTIPAQQSHKQRTRLHSEGNYDDVIMPTSNYENIALDAFEIVEDHVYDRADEFLKKHSSIYQLTASDAHMKAVTQMALAQSQKQGAQTDHQKTESDPLNQKFGRLRQHSVKESADPPLAMSPRTAAFVPPRNVPRPQLSPVHCLNTSSSDSTETQTRWKGPVSPLNSGSTPVVSKVQESSRLPPGAFAFPTIPPKDSEKFDIPTLPSKPSSKSTAAVPPPKTFNPGESPKKAAPMLPPKQAPIPPPRTTSEATIPPTKATHEAPTLPPKTVPKATIPPPRTPNSTSEAPILPSKPISEAPIPPPKTSPEAKVPMWTLPLKRVPEAPVPPRRASEPEPETLISPPKVSSSQSNSPAIHPKPLKRPAGAAAGVPTPPPKPSKQEPPPPPPKTGNSQFNKLNGSGDHRKRDLGGHTTFPLPGMRMLPANEIAQRAASLQHELNLTTSKRYYKPS